MKKTDTQPREGRRYFRIISGIVVILLSSEIIFGTLIYLILYTADRFGHLDEILRIPYAGMWVMCLFCIVSASVFAFAAVRSLLKPLESLINASKAVAAGDYSVRLKYNGRIAEINETFENFNYMTRQLSSVEMISSDFIANVSHEFRTPLSALNGYVTLLQDSSVTEEERDEYISKALFSIDKLNTLTENILTLSKLENQNFIGETVSYRLDEQIREAVVLLEPKWSEKNIEFDLELPEIMFNGQRSLLFQVWTNIIGNAIKFSHKGGVVVIKYERTEKHHKIYICDNGIGMTEETMRHIFDKFYQADTSRQSQGNGLGLALCREILLKCGGKIFVTGKPGEGSVFLIRLPVTSSESTE